MVTEIPRSIQLSDEEVNLVATACLQSFPRLPQNVATYPSKQETETAITRLYARIGLPAPLFFWMDNPEQLVEAPFLLQSLASVPHGSRRTVLRRSKMHLAPPDLGWQLGNKLKGEWLNSYISLCEQLTPQSLSRLYEYAHYESAMVAAYDQPDVVSTCGSRLGFSVVPALKSFMSETLLLAHSRISTFSSVKVSLEMQRLYEESNRRREWTNRAAASASIADQRGQQSIFSDLISSPAYGTIPDTLLFELKEQVGELIADVLDLQDTSCHHPRVDGTAALQTINKYAEIEPASDDRLLQYCGLNSIYRYTWGCWSRDQYPMLKAVESMWGRNLFEGQLHETINDFLTMRGGAFAYLLNSRCVFACALPVVAYVDTSSQWHNFEGPAVEFPDGYGLHIWRGMGVDTRLREDTAHLEIARIEQEQNAEIRRLLIDKYGTAKYLTDSKASVVQRDKFGDLLCKMLQGDEPIVVVRVFNSTPEPDGSFKSYYLRVPPGIETAHEAVAWTFGMTTDEYLPEMET